MVNSAKASRMLRDFGVRLRASRIAKGYREAADLAEILHMSPAAYRKYERGEAQPPIDKLNEICELLDKTSDFLLFGRMPPNF